METAIIVILVIILIGSIAGIFLAQSYNKIAIASLKINDAEIEIDEELRNMYDLIDRTIDTIQKINKIKLKSFDEVKNIKTDELTNFEIDRKLSDAYKDILIVKEDYAKLQKNKALKALSEDLNATEEKLVGLRTFYNKYVSEYNQLIKVFPSNIVAIFGGFKYKLQYDGRNLNDMIENDFKI